MCCALVCSLLCYLQVNSNLLHFSSVCLVFNEHCSWVKHLKRKWAVKRPNSIDVKSFRSFNGTKEMKSEPKQWEPKGNSNYHQKEPSKKEQRFLGWENWPSNWAKLCGVCGEWKHETESNYIHRLLFGLIMKCKEKSQKNIQMQRKSKC